MTGIPAASRAELLAVCAQVSADYPMISGGLVDRHLDQADPSWDWAQLALGYVRSRHPEGLTTVLEAFAMVSIDFIRLQGRFHEGRALCAGQRQRASPGPVRR